MGILYLAALIIGAGTIAVQLLMSGSGDADADADSHVEMEADVEADVDVEADAGHGPKDFHADGILPIFLSLRFWTFFFLAFGMVGTLLHYLRLTGVAIVPFLALGMGLFSGFLASYSFRLLSRATNTSAAESGDALGQLGRVVIPVRKNTRGKVRIELRGQTLDYLATTDDEELEQGTMVLVEEVRDSQIHVSRAPELLLPPKGEK